MRDTIADLAEFGVQLKIITGDNRLVAQHIAQTIGLVDRFRALRSNAISRAGRVRYHRRTGSDVSGASEVCQWPGMGNPATRRWRE
ncbi:MAG TPA: hypothetical protein DEP84_04715 [Chloroflexi bacterium]|nr:hypothetical protein [Chloroflexota bacterium]